MRLQRIPLIALLLLLPLACGDSTEPRVPTEIVLDRQALSLERGDTAHVAAEVRDADGNVFATLPEGMTLSWETSDPGIATIDDNVVTATGPGTASLTARAGDLTATLSVEVPSRFTGDLAFGYAGDRSGSFSVSSTFGVDQGFPDQNEWAFSIYDTDFDDQDLIGFRTDGTTYDLLYLWVDRRVTSTGPRQADGVIVFGQDFEDDQEYDALYVVTGGEVDFSRADPYRLAGTFELAMNHEETGAALNLTGGTFDVPIMTDADFGGPAFERVPPAIADQQLLRAIGERRRTLQR